MELTIDQALQRGIAAHRDGKFEEADKFYTAILKAQPGHADANHNMGILAVGLNKVEASLIFFKTALATNPNVNQYWLSYIDALIKLGRMNEARSILDQGKASGLQADRVKQFEDQLSANEPPVNNTDATQEQLDELVSLYTERHLDKALKKASALSRQFPNNANIFNILGAIYSEIQETDKAILNFKRAVHINPLLAEGYNNLANSFSKTNNFDTALKQIHQAIILSPASAIAFDNKGRILRKMTCYRAACVEHKKASVLLPGRSLFYKSLADIDHLVGNFPHSLTNYLRARTLDPRNDIVNHLIRALQNSSAETTPIKYITELFDEYAPFFDQHLVEDLNYNIPKKMKELLRCDPQTCQKMLNILDLGCGTGLAGEEFESFSKHLTGIDLSEAMIGKAREKNIYDELIVGTINAELERFKQQRKSFDLIICADVLIYIGDCKRLFSLVREVLDACGRFIFSTESLNEKSFRLLDSGRFGHSYDYILTCAKIFDFTLVEYKKVPLRKEKGSHSLAGIYCFKP